ncbi:MAG: ATP-binding protein [archaeon]
MIKDSIKKVVHAQAKELSSFDFGVERDNLSNLKPLKGVALVLSGVRRCGKSTLMQQIRKNTSKAYYFNFDDPKGVGFEVEDFEKLNQVFIEEFGESDYYFFDEIQNVEKWELFIRKLVDNKKQVVITGSNASLLSKELGTRLTGRHLRTELFPFSFNEFLQYKKQKPSIDSFKNYFEEGGFPEYLSQKKPQLLEELLNDVIARDIVVRQKLRERKTIKELAVYLLSNLGKEFSFNTLKKIFNLGSVNTAISFVSYLEDSYLLFTVERFDYSIKKRLIAPKKVYCVDNGFAATNSVSFSEDKGRMLENIVFLGLKRQNKEMYYFRENNECDFVVRKNTKIVEAMQVCFELTEENKGREIAGLLGALEKFKLNEGLILTYDQEDKLQEMGKTIIVKPVWKWLLEWKNKNN